MSRPHETTIGDLIQDLEEARNLALQILDPAAAVAATMGKAKLLGLIADREEVVATEVAAQCPASCHSVH